MSQRRTLRLIFAKRMVEKLEDALASGQGGVVSVTNDGNSVTWSREQAHKELEYWHKQVTRFSRSKSRTSAISLEGQHD